LNRTTSTDVKRSSTRKLNYRLKIPNEHFVSLIHFFETNIVWVQSRTLITPPSSIG